ncbi:MAG: nucleotidyltransferase domain-containing protein [Defluviitaleaceae bacterium]|nr:nucleotidyltransferase domain-containing protein [Defluviitaleaceae bacterium]
MLTIAEIKNAVEKVAPEYPVKQVQLFGSYADGFADVESDVDVIVEFSEWPISLWVYCGFQQALSDILGKKVDMLKFPFSKEASDEMSIQNVVHLYG